MKIKSLLLVIYTSFIALISTNAHAQMAGQITFDFAFDPNNTATSIPPYAALSFQEGNVPGTVDMQFTVSSNISPAEKIDAFFFNFHPSLDPNLLTFTFDQDNSTIPEPQIITAMCDPLFDTFVIGVCGFPSVARAGDVISYRVSYGGLGTIIYPSSFKFTDAGGSYLAGARMRLGNGNSTTAIFALRGDVAPLGAPDGQVNGGDLSVMLRIVLGIIPPDANLLGGGDIAPRNEPDGVIDISDLILMYDSIGL